MHLSALRQSPFWQELWRKINRQPFKRQLVTRLQPYLIKAVQGFPKAENVLASKTAQRFGEDAWFVCSTPKAEVLGVADGVGAWKKRGIDAGLFAKELMSWCAKLAKNPEFDARNPARLLSDSYYMMRNQEERIVGSSTACLATLHRSDSTLYTANLGDSGYMVLREGEIISRSDEQQHRFNSPYQLTLPPRDMDKMPQDSPELATSESVPLQQGDVILLATDGLFDNVFDGMLVNMLTDLHSGTSEEHLQDRANSLVAVARHLSLSPYIKSPFALKAEANQFFMSGGKPDDITVILAIVAMREVFVESA